VPDDPGQPDDRLAAAVAELYGAAPEEFTGRRGELTAAAREAGDRAAAKAIGALRRPTRAAWVVNALARADPGAPSQLAELGAALGAAQQAGQAARLRELSSDRWALIDALTSRALAAAGVTDPPPALRLEVTETLSAALADPETAAAFAAGTLTRAAQWSGFGLAPAAAGPFTGADPGGTLRAVPSQRGTPGRRRPGTAPAEPEKPAPPEKPARGETPARRRETTAERREAEAGRRAEEARQREAAAEQLAAEQAARRREQYQEAERAAAGASTAAAEAVAAEDRLEAEVRDLEERLTRARDDLAAARMRARRAEAAERRARQALDRLPGN
jgi:hypothetical protein